MHQPCQDQFLRFPNFSHITLEEFVRIESSQFSKTKIFVFHPIHHQVTKSNQTPKSWNLAMHQPCEDQFLLLPNFPHITLEAFVRFYSSQFSKIKIFVLNPHTPPSHKIKPKHKNHGTWPCTNHVNINSFCSQTSPTSLLRHLWGLSPARFPKPRFSFFTPQTTTSQNQAETPKSWNLALHQPCQDQFLRFPNFPTSLWRHLWGLSPGSFPKPRFSFFIPHTTKSQNQAKHQNHRTWLCTNHIKIKTFCSQTSPTSFWKHLWGFIPASFPKSRFSFFTPHTTKSQNQAKTQKSWNLAMHQQCQDQFLLLPNFSHITLEAFVRIEPSQFSKTKIFVSHPTHHQVTKWSQNTRIMELGHALTMSRSIPFAPKLLPHYFGGIYEVLFQPIFQN